MFTKFASFDVSEILDIKGAPTRQHSASLDKIGDYDAYRTSDGYMYVRLRAISSRVNKNHDGWPSVELAGSPEIFDRHHSAGGFTVEAGDVTQEFGFPTFLGKPIFVDHHNSNPKKARGVIVDSKLRVLDHKTAASDDTYWGGHDVDPEHMPPTEIELLLEIDAKSFPTLAKDIQSGDLDGFSMGCDVERSKCSHCGHIATNPDEYCSHILMKGAHHDFKTADGKKVSRKSYENCYGIKFFEISAVFEPADETALAREVKAGVHQSDVAPGAYPGEPGFKPDPVRPHDMEMDWVAQQMIDRGIDPETATELAQAQIEKQMGGPPGHGEGDVYMPKRVDYAPSDAQGMPGPGGLQGFPPPIRQNQPTDAFGDAAQEALNEQWPRRPRQNDPRWSVTKEAPGHQHMPGVSDKRNRQYEHIKDSLMDSGKDEERAKGEAARTVNKQRAEHGETKKSVRLPWQAKSIECPACHAPMESLGSEGHSLLQSDQQVERMRCPQCGTEGLADGQGGINNIRYASQHVAEHPLPQEFMTRAPEEVDTLREEKVCPICGSDMDAETCDVCGFVEPPKEFDNPDLDKAQEIRQEMKQQEEQQSTSPGLTPGGQDSPLGDGSPTGVQPGGPISGPMGGATTKPMATASVTSDMAWTPKVHPKTAARINQVEQPITTANRPASDEPAKAIVIKDQTHPVTSSMLTAQRLMANAQRNHTGGTMSTRTADGSTPPEASPDKRVDVVGVGGVDQASNEEASKADAQTDVTGIGGTGVEGVEADSTTSLPAAGRDSDDAGFNKDRTTEDSGPTKTFGDSDGGERAFTDPVTSQPFPRSEDGVKSNYRQAYEDGTLEGQEQQGDPAAKGGTAVKGVKPVSEQFGDRVNVLEHTTSPANNSGPTTTWSGTDGNGVLRQQEPVTREPTQFGGVNAHIIAAIRLADAELELGLLDQSQKYDRIAELELTDPRVIRARIDTLSQVKTAGLAKLATARQSGVRRLPSAFGKNTAAPHGFDRIASEVDKQSEPVSDALLDAALFTR